MVCLSYRRLEKGMGIHIRWGVGLVQNVLIVRPLPPDNYTAHMLLTTQIVPAIGLPREFTWDSRYVCLGSGTKRLVRDELYMLTHVQGGCFHIKSTEICNMPLITNTANSTCTQKDHSWSLHLARWAPRRLQSFATQSRRHGSLTDTSPPLGAFAVLKEHGFGQPR